MSTWRYGKLLSLTIKHQYFKDEQCSDWQLLPSPETKQLLLNHDLKWKDQSSETKTAAIIFGELVGENLKFPLQASAKLVIYLKLKRGQFQQYTDPSMCPDSQILVFRNALAEGNTLATRMHKAYLFGTRFSQKAPTPLVDGMEVVLADYEENEIARSKVENGNYAFALPTEQKGRFQLKFPSSTALDPVPIYVDAHAKQLGIGGIIELANDVGNGLARADFELKFRAKSKPWTYIVALSPSSENLSCTVVDKQGVLFSPVDDLDLVGTGYERYVTAIEKSNPNSQVFVFQSEVNMNWQEVPRLGIQLIRTDTSEPMVLDSNCPAPLQNDFVLLNKRISEFQIT